ncbi:MAG TPA: hypothetical protein VJB87_02710 [Candidatus Nanoarchaeia archaeon]|nr:hypothetical protein [Candidatus Nanoarchaeia archaeon]
MADLYDTTIVCDQCNKKTEKTAVPKHGFTMRGWTCPSCKKTWLHPDDQREFEEFKKLHHREFNVKLRMVGNSYTVSIPREIIDFEHDFENEIEEMSREMDKMLRLMLEEPGKLSIFFKRGVRKKSKEEEEHVRNERD